MAAPDRDEGPGPHPGPLPSGAGRRALIFRSYLTFLLAAFAFIYPWVFDAKLDLNGDNARYYILGKALALGRGYVNMHTPDQAPAENVPPGYPALIGAVMRLASDDFVAVKTANGVCFLLALMALFWLFTRLAGNLHLAFVACLGALLNGHLLRYATLMMSEIPFLLFSTLALCLAARLRIDDRPLANPLFLVLLLGLVGSFYVRTAGVALLGGVVLQLGWRRNWRLLGAR